MIQKNKPAKIEEKYPQYDWKKLWGNLNNKQISTKWRSAMYKAVNDTISVGDKLKRHGLATTDLCTKCKKTDSITHRLKECDKSKSIWEWVKKCLGKQFRINIDIMDIYQIIQESPKDVKDKNVWMFFVGSLMYNNLEKHSSKLDLILYKDRLRLIRLGFIRNKYIINFSNKIYCF